MYNEASTLVVNNPRRSRTTADRVAKGLGWFSIGLGLVELVAPGRVARAVGLEGSETLLRAYGGREVGAGVWALSTNPAPAIWSRVAGDIVDLGTLAGGLRDGDEERQRNAKIAAAAVLGFLVIDLITAVALTSEQSEDKGEQRDYSERSGFPGGVAQARGGASDFETPADMKAAPPQARISGDLQSA